MKGDEDVALIEFVPELADELVAMWRASFEGGVGVVDPHPVEEQRNYLLRKLAPKNELRLAMIDSKIVGFAAASPESVVQLYVHVDHQGRGIGTKLLGWAKSQSSGSLWLYTFERNKGAQRFYERNGFTILERGFEEEWQLADIKYWWARSTTD